RPSIAHDVMHGGERDVLFRSEPEDERAQQRPAHQVERPTGLLPPPVLRLTPARRGGHRGEIDQRQWQWRQRGGRADGLERLAARFAEDRAERLVAADDLAERVRQGADVEPTAELEEHRQVEDGGLRIEPFDEPDALLTEGEREAAGGGGVEPEPSAHTGG